MTIEVTTRNLTRSPDEDEPLPPLLLELEQQAMLLRELIAVTVTEQINELAARRALEPANASIEVSRHYLL
ncbi:MAG: hypothetical protein HKO10_04110, partial [Acidimicrobiia bacterium]|nr:hypothetical protein [Acidimicrobiia bacterium]